MKKIFTTAIALIGLILSAPISATDYSPQTVHINKNVSLSIPRSWTRRSNLPIKNLAALFAPNMDMNLPNVSIFVIPHSSMDPREYVRNLAQHTSNIHVFALFKKELGDDEAVIIDMSTNRQEVYEERHFLWRHKTIKNHSTRSIHAVFEHNDTLFVVGCSAATDVHIRDCQLIMNSLKAHSKK